MLALKDAFLCIALTSEVQEIWLSSGRTQTCNNNSHTANSSAPRLKRTALGTSLWPEASLLSNNLSFLTREMQAVAGPHHQGPLTYRPKTEVPAFLGNSDT